jgi:hypothetical protein
MVGGSGRDRKLGGVLGGAGDGLLERKERRDHMTRDEGRAFIRARLDSQFGKTHNISDEGSSRTQLVSFMLRPAAAGATDYVLEIHEDLLDSEDLETRLAEAHVIDQFRHKGVRRLRIPPNGPAEVLERYE